MSWLEEFLRQLQGRKYRLEEYGGGYNYSDTPWGYGQMNTVPQRTMPMTNSLDKMKHLIGEERGNTPMWYQGQPTREQAQQWDSALIKQLMMNSLDQQLSGYRAFGANAIPARTELTNMGMGLRDDNWNRQGGPWGRTM